MQYWCYHYLQSTVDQMASMLCRFSKRFPIPYSTLFLQGFGTQLCKQFNSDISPSWLALKFAKMEASPFIFYRGSDQLFFLDWSYNGALESFGNSTTRVWIQGDMHVENMGSFMNSGGDVVYEANDFDESLVGPYQLDVWR